MTREADWLLIEDALQVMLQHAPSLNRETVSLHAAAGRVLAQDVIAPADQPPHDNSAMDGYAVRAEDVRGAEAAAPVELRVVDDIPAGGTPRAPIRRGEAARIMTGAPIPDGADSVIRVEHTLHATATSVHVVDDADAGRNVRRRGEDVRHGKRVLHAGRRLDSAAIGILAMTGHATVTVARRPDVAVLATGDELVDVTDYVPESDRIVNSNSPALAAALTMAGCTPHVLGIARDDVTDIRRLLGQAMTADALITTAGASMGDHDVVKDALEEVGCRTLFWRVRIRPGSPFSFGVIERPDRAPLPVFGLPGNPVSALVTWNVLVAPVLRRMMGRTAIYPRVRAVRAGEDIGAPTGLVRFLRVRLEPVDGDLERAYLTGPQGSGILTSVAGADALLIVPLDVRVIGEGETALALPLNDGDTAASILQFTSLQIGMNGTGES